MIRSNQLIGMWFDNFEHPTRLECVVLADMLKNTLLCKLVGATDADLCPLALTVVQTRHAACGITIERLPNCRT
jgi:hypothetical protein